MSKTIRKPLVALDKLSKYFPLRTSVLSIFGGRGKFIRAVDNVTMDILEGEILALVGESGSGKTTLGKLLVKLHEPTSGRIFFDGKDVTHLKDKEELRWFRRNVQMVFQDPFESLNPRMTVYDLIAEPLKIHKLIKTEDEASDMVNEVLEAVGLTPPKEFIMRYPHQLSGGQRQRVAIARALILNPKFIVADEPISMLDASIRAGILNLLLDLREQRNITIMYITHDIATARHVSDRIAVMYRGQIVEFGDTDEVINDPLHPYTEALIAAVPNPDPDVKRSEIPIKEPQTQLLYEGCRFRDRCPKATEKCSGEIPEVEVGNRRVRCILYS